MDNSSWGSVSRNRLVENITLLRMLNEIPESTKEHTLPDVNDPKRGLSLQREKEIVDNLAFLSSITDDRSRIMAVCIEEEANLEGLTIRLAVNDGDLVEEKRGFEEIARVLELAALRVHTKLQDTTALLHQVVSLDYFRILSRLRSRHAKSTRKTQGKPALLPQLNEAIQDTSIVPRGKVTEDELSKIRSMARDLQRLFVSFEAISDHRPKSSTVQETASSIIILAHELSSLLEPALNMTTKLDPSLKRHLPEAVGKLGRYYTASCELISAARSKSNNLFRRIKVETCQVPGPSNALVSSPPSTLINTVQNVLRPGTPQQQRALRSSLESLLAKPLRTSELEFQSQNLGNSKARRVHAEIQLLFFYELHPGISRPRVICSSKSACYLCDLFVRCHGQFHMSRTHGRLYSKWNLPGCYWDSCLKPALQNDMKIATQKFNSGLEEKIRSIFGNGRATLCNHPNESVLIAPAHWSSSTLSKALHSPAALSTSTIQLYPNGNGIYNDRYEGATILQVSQQMDETSSQSTIRSIVSTVVPGEIATAGTSPASVNQSVLLLPDTNEQTEKDIQPSKTPSDAVPSSVASEPSVLGPQSLPDFTPPVSTHLARDESVYEELLRPDQSVRVDTDAIHLSISRDCLQHTDFDIGARCLPRCWVRVKWLDKNAVSQDFIRGTQVLGLEDMAEGSAITTSYGAAEASTELYIRQGGDTISVKYSYANPVDNE